MRDPTDLVCCPRCHGLLDAARCVACGAEYGAVDGVLDLVVGAGAHDPPRPARRLLHAAAANPRVYDAIQRAAGREAVKSRIGPALADTRDSVVLDVGAGTGAMAPLVDASARYVWLDSDPQKLAGFHGREAILANALHMAVRDRSVDDAICSAVSHHLDDEGLAQLLAELHRIVRGRLFFLDAVRTRSPVGSLLWSLDRGAHARTAGELVEAIETRFEIERREDFAVLHRYLFVVARP